MRPHPLASLARAPWLLLATLLACMLAWACSQGGVRFLDDGDDPEDEPSSSGGKGTKRDAANGPDDPSGSGQSPDKPDGPEQPATGDATEQNLKVAFIGDTASQADFKTVLELVKAEKADFLMIQGDLTYDGEKATNWFPVIDNTINKTQPGSTADVTIPYFVSKGNHDSDWQNLGSGLKARMAAWNIPASKGDPTTINYSVVHKGLKMVMVADTETSPTRASFLEAELKDDTHHWKICSWHKNQGATNVGGKSDEMGWQVYETCRQHGAIVLQGHSHSYSRSKTITNDTTQVVDPACSDPFALCVGPGKHFWVDSSLGGHDIRKLTTVKDRPYWGATYGGSFGALFLEFHVDGDPKKARGYFKTVGGTIIDPPTSSGKTSFTITRAP